MKKNLLFIVFALLAYGAFQNKDIWIPESSVSQTSSEEVLQRAYNNRQSNLQVQGKGNVIKILADDLKGSRHQQFIVKLASGQTIFIAHNIDLAPKIMGLRTGDTVEFYGEYEWNSKGGIIHWTHHDPNNRHIAGWLKHENRIYQ